MGSDEEFLPDTQSQAYSEITDISPLVEQNEVWGRLFEANICMKNLGIRKRPKFYLNNTGHSIDLTGTCYTAGRASSNNYVFPTADLSGLQYRLLSKVHYKITKNGNDPNSPAFIENISRNGTFVNFERVHKRILSHGDLITASTKAIRAMVYRDQRTHDSFPQVILKKYHIGKILGAGASGTVYLVHNLRTCQPFALKAIEKKPNTNFDTEKAMIEANILRKLDHPAIIKLHETMNTSKVQILRLELMNGGNLLSRLNAANVLPENLLKLYLYQVCHAVKFIHDKKIIHRDLKPENILLASNDSETLVKISDFGLSSIGSVLRTMCGTPLYMAPEILANNTYSAKIDIWSLGVVIYVCLSGIFPDFNESYFADGDSIQMATIKNHFKLNAPIWQSISIEAKILIDKLLTIDASKRPSINDLLGCKWFNDTKIKKLAHKIMNLPLS